MNTNAWGLLALYLVVLLAAAWPLGLWLARLATGRMPGWMHKVEAPFYQLAGTSPEQAMHWTHYTLALLAFNTLGALMVYALQRLQLWLPLNPQGLAAVSADSAFNTAVSFVTNTDWQGYAGESTLGYLTQMLGLAVQSFFSAATGIAVAFALMRGFAARTTPHPQGRPKDESSPRGTDGVRDGPGAHHNPQGRPKDESSPRGTDGVRDGPGADDNSIGNFWVDIVRLTAWVLVPLSLGFAVFLVGQGVIQNFDAYKAVSTLEVSAFQQPKVDAAGVPVLDAKGQPVLEAAKTQTQTLPMGPVASQEAIKMIGTNGGGFFNANSAHPFENPTALSNFLQMLAIFLIPAALCFTFGRVVGDPRQGWALLSAMTILFVAAVLTLMPAEQDGNPLLTPLGVDQLSSSLQPGGNMEGKELRYGITASSLFAVITTAASCGAVNAMHDSFTPLGGMVPLVLMQLGEVVFGGVGSGLYGMLIFAILAVFIAGLMIGRTPEYLGKKIEVHEMKLTSIAILVTPLVVLTGTAVAVMADGGLAGIANPGVHGFSEILYALSSAGNNNGSAFAGLSANTPFYNILLSLVMWVGRFGMIVPVLAIAGSLAAKQRLPVTAGTLPTHGPLFVALLIGTVLLVGLLNYVPALALGPMVEHLVLWATP